MYINSFTDLTRCVAVNIDLRVPIRHRLHESAVDAEMSANLKDWSHWVNHYTLFLCALPVVRRPRLSRQRLGRPGRWRVYGGFSRPPDFSCPCWICPPAASPWSAWPASPHWPASCCWRWSQRWSRRGRAYFKLVGIKMGVGGSWEAIWGRRGVRRTLKSNTVKTGPLTDLDL